MPSRPACASPPADRQQQRRQRDGEVAVRPGGRHLRAAKATSSVATHSREPGREQRAPAAGRSAPTGGSTARRARRRPRAAVRPGRPCRASARALRAGAEVGAFDHGAPVCAAWNSERRHPRRYSTSAPPKPIRPSWKSSRRPSPRRGEQQGQPRQPAAEREEQRPVVRVQQRRERDGEQRRPAPPGRAGRRLGGAGEPNARANVPHATSASSTTSAYIRVSCAYCVRNGFVAASSAAAIHAVARRTARARPTTRPARRARRTAATARAWPPPRSRTPPSRRAAAGSTAAASRRAAARPGCRPAGRSAIPTDSPSSIQKPMPRSRVRSTSESRTTTARSPRGASSRAFPATAAGMVHAGGAGERRHRSGG